MMYGLLKYFKRLFKKEKEVISPKIAFMTFLWLQGVYEEFVRDFNNFNGDLITLGEYLDSVEPLEYMTGAFSWEDEDWLKWSSLNVKWQFYVSKEI